MRKRPNFRILATCLYAAFFAIYLYIGLQPVDNVHYEIAGELSIPEINLDSPVTMLKLEGKTLTSPSNIVGAYSVNSTKTLLIAHSATAFKNLKGIEINDQIYYQGKTYQVTDLETKPKNNINMQEILSPTSQPTLILMTCAGTSLGNYDATHRLIVTAKITEKDGIID